MAFCSNASQSYLTYSNPVVWPSVASNDAWELDALKVALALGQILNRVIILPRFHCSKSATDIGSNEADLWAAKHRGARPPAGASTASATPRYECPMNCLLNVTAFDTEFEGLYRESSFLRHPLVPSAVRDDLSSPQDVHGQLLSSVEKDSVNGRNTMPATAVQLSEDEVVELFGASPHHVLIFKSLYRVHPRFASDAEQRTFDNRVRKAFRRGTYRQL